MSPRKRTSPWRPSSARATEIFILEVSRPTKAALSCCMARPLCVRLRTGLSGATLAPRLPRGEPPPLQKRTYGLPVLSELVLHAVELLLADKGGDGRDRNPVRPRSQATGRGCRARAMRLLDAPGINRAGVGRMGQDAAHGCYVPASRPMRG